MRAVCSNRHCRFSSRFHCLMFTLDRRQSSSFEPQTHTAVGRFLALLKHDWEAGIPHLPLGADTKLQEAAQKDTAAATGDAKDQMAAGDSWYDAANAVPALYGRIVFGASAVLFGVIALMWHDSDTWQTLRQIWSLPFGIIIGGGLAGLSSAVALAEAG